MIDWNKVLIETPEYNRGLNAGRCTKDIVLGEVNTPIVIMDVEDLRGVALNLKNTIIQSISIDKPIEIFMSTLFNLPFLNAFVGDTPIRLNNQIPVIKSTEFCVFPMLCIDQDGEYKHDPRYSALAWVVLQEPNLGTAMKPNYQQTRKLMGYKEKQPSDGWTDVEWIVVSLVLFVCGLLFGVWL